MDHVYFGIQINSDKTLVTRQASTQRILELRLQAPQAAKTNSRPNLNLALVLDRSGSMRGEKLEYVKQAASHVLDQLHEHDQAALVVYDDTIQVIAHSTKITHGNRFEIKQRISGFQAGNMTDLCDGWLTGCKEAASVAQEGTINRTLLLTDGLANVGQTDPEILAQHAFELYKDAVSTSTFGVGEGFNEHLLEAMANRGGGNFYFIPNPDTIPEIFMREFNGLVGITVRNVEIKLALPPSVAWHVLGGWSAEYIAGHLHIYVGDMLSGKLQDIYLQLQIPSGEQSVDFTIGAKAFGKGVAEQLYDVHAEMVFKYADQPEVDAETVNHEIMERFSAVELADEATEALKLERQGRREEADRRMQGSLGRNQPYVATQTANHYRELSNRMKNGMTEADRKMSHWDVYNIKRKKDQGKEEKKD
jgi:Ca-activated chloride channel family protein